MSWWDGKLVGGASTSFLVTKEAVELRSVVNDLAKEYEI